MNCFIRRFVLALGAIAAATQAEAAISVAALLPDTTKGVVLVADLAALRKHWEQCDMGKLANDPIMKQFEDDFDARRKENGNDRLDKLGLSMKDLEAVVGGEVGAAVILLPLATPLAAPPKGAPPAAGPRKTPPAGIPAQVLVADVSGHEKEAAALLATAAGNLVKQNGKLVSRPGDAITVYSLPPKAVGKPPRTAAYFFDGKLLATGDDVNVLAAILAAHKTPRKDALADFTPFGQTMQRCALEAGATPPDLRWFVEPFGYLEASRILNPPMVRPSAAKKPDRIAVFKQQGFSVIQGLGGYVNFALGKYELLHRTAVYAPADPAHKPKEKYQLAARMLDYPNGGKLLPESFVPREVATSTSFNWNVLKAFDSVETLVDALARQKGTFSDALESMRDDPHGPKVDIRLDIVAKLGTRCALVTDYAQPIDSKAERKAFVVETLQGKDVEVAAALKKLYAGAADVKIHDFEGHKIYEIIEPVAPPPAPGKQAEPANNGRLLKNGAVCSALGHLFIASHVDFLKKLLHDNPAANRLAAALDQQVVNAELDRLIGMVPGRQISFRVFSRTDESYRVNYELIRTDKMPQADTLLANVLDQFLSDGVNARKQRIDGKNLPNYDAIRKYLGPAGHFITSEDSGWFAVGFSLHKDANTSDRK